MKAASARSHCRGWAFAYACKKQNEQKTTELQEGTIMMDQIIELHCIMTQFLARLESYR